jgi:hypothetical protein
MLAVMLLILLPHLQVTCVASTGSDSTVLVSGRDTGVALWDLRTQTTTRMLRAPGFTVWHAHLLEYGCHAVLYSLT